MAETEVQLRQLANGKLSPEQFLEILRPHKERMVEIFSGEDPAHPGIAGWNPGGLRGLLRVELHDYRVALHKIDQDPIASLLDFLVDEIAARIKANPRDMDAYHVTIVPLYRISIDKLMGVGRRSGQPEELPFPPGLGL